MTHGLFEWVDVAVPDLDAGIAFYSAVFGWDAQPVDSAEGHAGYVMFYKDGQLAAGMSLLGAGSDTPASWTSYVSVDDVGVIAARALELGAEVIVAPMDVSDAGRMTYLRDPQGASIGFWEAGTHTGADAFNRPGFLTWNGLGSRDVPGSKSFYSTLLPEWEFHDSGTDDAPFWMIKVGDRDNAGLGALSDEFSPDTPTHWRVFFVVDDARTSLGVVEANGGQAIGPVVDTGFGPVVRVADPFGAAFLIIGPMAVS